jgi:hypothetical protein
MGVLWEGRCLEVLGDPEDSRGVSDGTWAERWNLG